MEGMNIVPEEELIKYPVSYRWGTQMNWSLLIIHVALLIVFGVWGAWTMVLVNCCSVLVYLKMFPTIKQKPGLYMRVAILEVLVHMIFAVVCIGWSAGFFTYTFVVVPFAFFTDYTVRKDGAKGFNPVIIAVISVITFIMCKVISMNVSPVYAVEKLYIDIMCVVNGFMVLTIMATFAYIYINNIVDNETELMDVAEYDALTELGNRHRIDRVLPLYGIDIDASKSPYAVAILDIDNFKKVNDNFGHLAGDQVLRDMARILRHYESSDTLIFRWGGEEFMIIIIGDDPYKKMMTLCEKVRCDVAGNVSMFDYFRIVVTVSSGVAQCSVGEGFKELTDRADKCLYQAKGNGKNQVVGAKDIGLE